MSASPSRARLSPTDDVSDREIVQTRVFAAPRALVFKMFTDPEHVGRWWGPRGFTTTIHEMNVKPGGVWRFIMHGPDGVDYDNRITYSEVTPNERLVYLHDSDKDNDPRAFHVTITFAEQDGKTRLTMRSLFPSAEACDRVKPYAVPGGQQTLDRLGDMLATLGAGDLARL